MFRSPRVIPIAATLSLVAWVLGGCGSTNASSPAITPPKVRSVSTQLALIPQSAFVADQPGQSIFVSWVDVDRAATVAGLARPKGDAERTKWLTDLSKRPGIILVLPTLMTAASPTDYNDIAKEVGVHPAGVDTGLEVIRPPFRFSALSGDFTEAGLTHAMRKPTDRMWSVGPVEDDAISAAGRSRLRKVGQGLRFAMVDGTVLMSSSTSAVRDAITGGSKLFDQKGDLQAIATEFDKQKVFSAQIILGVGPGSSGGLTERIDEVKTRLGVASATPPIESIGIGLVSTTEAVFIYTHATAEIAKLQEAMLPQVFASGLNEMTGKPLAEIFTVSSITRNDTVVIVNVKIPAEKMQAPFALLTAMAVPFRNGPTFINPQ
jgi:hypothetical protein